MKEDIIRRERTKYNHIHQREKYGAKTGRVKQFALAKDGLHKSVKAALKDSESLIDIGCGKGGFMDFFRNRYPHLEIVGLDIAEEVKKHRPDLNIVISDAGHIPFEDERFDFVCHQDGLEHIPEELLEDTMKEEFRVCKKYMYFTVATHEVKHNDDIYREMGLGAIHINMKTVKEWKQVFIKYFADNSFSRWIFDADKNWVYVYLEK